MDVRLRPSLTRGRSTFTYYPNTVRIPEGAAPDLKNKSYTVTADVEIPEGGADGVLITQGGRFGGWGLLVLDGKPQFVHAFSNQPQHKYRVASNEALTPGAHTIKFDLRRGKKNQRPATSTDVAGGPPRHRRPHHAIKSSAMSVPAT
jgi:arylsulfatase